VDATALSRREMVMRFAPRDSVAHRVPHGTEPADFITPAGVLYPYITETFGMNPLDVARFNEEQAETRHQFSVYYEEAHGRVYIFAEQELQQAFPGSDAPILPPATESKLWLPSPRNY